jgi:hypothetical protein
MAFNIKASGVAAIGAFVLSFLIGLMSGGSILMVLFRAGILGAGFFVLVTCAQVLVHQFLPELTTGEAAVDTAPGSRLDISVDNTSSNDDELAALLASAGVDTGESSGADSKAMDKPVLSQVEALRYDDNLEREDHSNNLPALDDKQDGKLESDPQAFNKKYGEVNPAKNYTPKDLASAITTMLKQ